MHSIGRMSRFSGRVLLQSMIPSATGGIDHEGDGDDGVTEKQHRLHCRAGHEQRHGEQRVETVGNPRDNTSRISYQRLFAKFHRLSERIANSTNEHPWQLISRKDLI